MKKEDMGLVYADIELINAGDLEMVRRNYMDKDEIKRMRLNILVDSGADIMAINEGIQEVLQLPFIEKRKIRLANDTIVEYDVVGPVIVKFENRTASCNALLLDNDAEPLLGVIPMEEMDVVINPLKRQLLVNPDHLDGAVLRLK
jgi:clan AA aspartic protease